MGSVQSREDRVVCKWTSHGLTIYSTLELLTSYKKSSECWSDVDSNQAREASLLASQTNHIIVTQIQYCHERNCVVEPDILTFDNLDSPFVGPEALLVERAMKARSEVRSLSVPTL